MISETWALTKRELEKWYKIPTIILASLIQPVVWIGLFGNSFNPSKLLPLETLHPPPGLSLEVTEAISAFIAEANKSILEQTFQGAPNYLTFLTGGVLSVIVLFTSLFSGGSIVWDRRFGFLDKLLVAPIPRSSIYFAKVFSSVIRGLVQASIIFVAALLMPGGLVLANPSPIIILTIFGALFLLALGFSSLFVAIALRIKRWETLIAISNLVNLPLLFASSALFPTSIMPIWLQRVASVNPISYSADLARTLFIEGVITPNVIFDFQVLIIFAITFTGIGSFASRYGLRG